MSLKKKLEEEQINSSGTSSEQKMKLEQIDLILEQNNLLKQRIEQIESTQKVTKENTLKLQHALNEQIGGFNSDFKKEIKNALSSLNTDVVEQINKKQSEQLDNLINKNNELEKELNKINGLNAKFHKFQAISQYVFYMGAMILFIFLVARTILLGVWNGLFLSNLWALEEWYYKALTILIIALLVAAIVRLLYLGIEEFRDRW